MKGILALLSGAAAAFFLTAGAFLLLANLGSNVAESDLPPRSPDTSPAPPLQLNLQEEQLAALEPRPQQRFDLEVSNASAEAFSNVTLTLRVLPTDTTLAETRHYRVAVSELEAGESEKVRFEVDLSRLEARSQRSGEPSGETKQVLMEVQATTPEGISAVRTVILPF